MSLSELIKECPSVKIEISAADLLDTMRSVTTEIIERYEKVEQPEEYLTRKQTAQVLDVDLSSLWRWQRQNYLVPIEIGGKRRYKLSDINKILKAGG